ncbi:class I SAM-dependent methyltransferase [Alloiococcus sp. CFN-8]|uniref:class I SAM-dependent methyltransferase n=1 Tax=Alloiococcus sp. CFN-8 TaxID=3416081 RepID=UPI003CF928B8
MREQAKKNKTAWEYRAYEFWNSRGTPEEIAEQLKVDPLSKLKLHKKYFKNIDGMKVANVCGSNGRKAVPLALLGADVTIFDISEENKRYAKELADCADVNIKYEVGDFCEVSMDIFKNSFDMAYTEGGILHYFSDLDIFMNTIYELLKPKGQLILSDFHPLRKINSDGQTEGDYFDSRIFNGAVAYKKFFNEKEQSSFPDCSLRFYTLSEIINSVIRAGFTIKEFNEHPNYENEKLPGLFTIYAVK